MVQYEIEEYCQNGSFLTAFFPADRQTKLEIPKGVEEVALEKNYSVEQYPVEKLLKYMVHLKTQQAYAKNENDAGTEGLVREWFSIFEEAIRKLMDDSSVFMEYDYRNYNFQIHQDGRNPYGFNELSDGYSAAIYILADLLMRMDQNWLLNGTSLNTSMEGIVLIDEVETHLHLELQRTMLPFLTEMFPNLQFIVTTHSPFVVNSLQDAVVYDLENKILVRDGLSSYSYSGIVEGYFRADELSETLRKKFTRYKELTQKQALTDEEYDEIMGLEQYLDEIPDYLSLGIATEYKKLKLEFEQREDAE